MQKYLFTVTITVLFFNVLNAMENQKVSEQPVAIKESGYTSFFLFSGSNDWWKIKFDTYVKDTVVKKKICSFGKPREIDPQNLTRAIVEVKEFEYHFVDTNNNRSINLSKEANSTVALGNISWIRCFAFDPFNKNQLAMGFEGSQILIWDLEKNSMISHFKCPNDVFRTLESVMCLAYDPHTPNVLAVCGGTGAGIYLLDTTTGTTIKRLDWEGAKYLINAVSMQYNPRVKGKIAVYTSYGTVYICDVATNTWSQALPADKEGQVGIVFYDPDVANTLIACGRNKIFTYSYSDDVTGAKKLTLSRQVSDFSLGISKPQRFFIYGTFFVAGLVIGYYLSGLTNNNQPNNNHH